MAIGDPIIPPIPAVGTSGTTYASQLVDFLNEVKERLEDYVPISSLLVSLLDMANNAVENLSYASFYEQTAEPSTPVGSLQNYEGNLWWVSESGAAQLTSGNSLNAAAISGIAGDYGGGNPASFRFSDADETFYAYDDYGQEHWAWLGARGLYVYGAEESTTRVKLTAADATDNYTITFADALPADQTLVQIAADGDLLYTNELVENANITLSGTGKICHDVYTVGVPLLGALATTDGDGSEVLANNSTPGLRIGAALPAYTYSVYHPIYAGISRHHTVTGFALVLTGSAPGSAITYELVVPSGGYTTFTGTGISVSTTSTAPSATGEFSMGGNSGLWIKITMPASTSVTIRALAVGYKSEV